MSENRKEKKEKAEEKDPALFWKVLSIISLAGFFILFFQGYTFEKKGIEKKNLITYDSCSEASVKRAIKFINENLVKPGSKASLINYSSENVCWILTEYRGNKIPIILKNGSDLVLPYNVINLDEAEKRIAERKRSFEEKVKKTSTPDVKLFIMSFCPYGRQAAKAMIPVYALLKNKANIEFRYVIYPKEWYKGREKEYCIGNYCSMHGINETREDVRELCIANLYGKDKLVEYLEEELQSCTMSNIDICSKEIMERIGIDSEKIEKCVGQNATAYLKEEYELNKKYGVTGSPTLLINEVRYTGQRTPEAFKNAICSAFIQPPKECEQTLPSSSASPGTCE